MSPPGKLFKSNRYPQVWAPIQGTGGQTRQLTPGTPSPSHLINYPVIPFNPKVSLVEPVYEAGENFARIWAFPWRKPINPIDNRKVLIKKLARYLVPKEAVLILVPRP